jgi:cell fate (sporulation/competence/biofilm development) regulator YlbF (YheA/YmcA/DUF963 family)
LNKIIKAAEALADSFNNSKEFKLFLELKEQIESNAQLKNKIGEFKKMSFSFEAKKTQGIETDFEEEKLIGRMYADVIMTDVGRQYIDAENTLFDMLSSVHNIMDNTEFAQIQKGFL